MYVPYRNEEHFRRAGSSPVILTRERPAICLLPRNARLVLERHAVIRELFGDGPLLLRLCCLRRSSLCVDRWCRLAAERYRLPWLCPPPGEVFSDRRSFEVTAN